MVLGFPCNQFGAQEPGDAAEIAAFVAGKGVSFQICQKVMVNGPQADPIFVFLKSKLPGFLGSFVKWNFTKWLCDRRGVPKKRYGPTTPPSGMVADIEALLAESAL